MAELQGLPFAHQTMCLELLQRCMDATFDEQFPENASFIRMEVKAAPIGTAQSTHRTGIRVSVPAPERTHVIVTRSTSRQPIFHSFNLDPWPLKLASDHPDPAATTDGGVFAGRLEENTFREH